MEMKRVIVGCLFSSLQGKLTKGADETGKGWHSECINNLPRQHACILMSEIVEGSSEW